MLLKTTRQFLVYLDITIRFLLDFSLFSRLLNINWFQALLNSKQRYLWFIELILVYFKGIHSTVDQSKDVSMIRLVHHIVMYNSPYTFYTLYVTMWCRRWISSNMSFWSTPGDTLTQIKEYLCQITSYINVQSAHYSKYDTCSSVYFTHIYQNEYYCCCNSILVSNYMAFNTFLKFRSWVRIYYTLSNFGIKHDVIAYLLQVTIKHIYEISAKRAGVTRSEVHNLLWMTSRQILKLVRV